MAETVQDNPRSFTVVDKPRSGMVQDHIRSFVAANYPTNEENIRITEDGFARQTEAGDTRITED